jgi:uncharacterized protein YabE (DUF348 family)
LVQCKCMRKKSLGFISIALILIGVTLLWIGSRREITLIVDGQPMRLWTRAMWVGWALKDAGINVHSSDVINPTLNQLIGWRATILMNRSRRISVYKPGSVENVFYNSSFIIGNLLASANVKVFPGDMIRWNGLVVSVDFKLPLLPGYALFFTPARSIQIEKGEKPSFFFSSGTTLGDVLWQNGEQLIQADLLSTPFEQIAVEVSKINLQRARYVTVEIGGMQFKGMSAGQKVSQGLDDVGLILEGLDYSIPSEDEVLPVDGKLKVMRVDEAVELQQSLIPYETEYVADQETELDQRSVVQPGKFGIQVTRKRIKYEDGNQRDGVTDSQWTASEPVTQKLGYGTKIVIRTLDTPDGPIEYWRTLNVYATAYSPCGLGNVPKCYYGTSLGVPVKRGVIAVIYKWFLLMGGEPVYVPGYGKAIIADVGGGIPGRDWIDLGFTDAELEEWHQYVTLYFLTPVPPDVPWILP